MLKKLILVSILAVVLSGLGFTHAAYAHFLVQDTQTGVKAVFHVAPDDDPIAGEQSVISFDFSKTGIRAKDFSYSLTIKPTKGEAESVPITVESNVLLANHTFPSQGFYDIVLTASRKDNGTESKLQYGQRISRGTKAANTESLGPIEIAAIVATAAIAIGAVIFSVASDNKRKGNRNDKKNHK